MQTLNDNIKCGAFSPEDAQSILSTFIEAESSEAEAKSDPSFFTTEQMGRFLRARDGDKAKALKLAIFALKWRRKRNIPQTTSDDTITSSPPPSELVRSRSSLFQSSPSIPVSALTPAQIRHESSTGKQYFAGIDKHGRAVVVFDNTVQNTKDGASHMSFMGWNFELAIKAMELENKKRKEELLFSPRSQKPTSSFSSSSEDPASSSSSSIYPAPHLSLEVTKWVVFLKLQDLTFRNNPPMSVIRETVDVVTQAYPERLGLLVCFCAPSLFLSVFNLIKPLVDEKTKNKIMLVSKENCVEGSPDDLLLRELIGADYRSTCNVDAEVEVGKMSPGYSDDKYWPKIQQIEKDHSSLLKEKERESAFFSSKISNFAFPAKKSANSSLAKAVRGNGAGTAWLADPAVDDVLTSQREQRRKKKTFKSIVHKIGKVLSMKSKSLSTSENSSFDIAVKGGTRLEGAFDAAVEEKSARIEQLAEEEGERSDYTLAVVTGNRNPFPGESTAAKVAGKRKVVGVVILSAFIVAIALAFQAWTSSFAFGGVVARLRK